MKTTTKEKFYIKSLGDDRFGIIDKKTDETFFRGRITEVGAWLALYDEGMIS